MYVLRGLRGGWKLEVVFVIAIETQGRFEEVPLANCRVMYAHENVGEDAGRGEN